MKCDKDRILDFKNEAEESIFDIDELINLLVICSSSTAKTDKDSVIMEYIDICTSDKINLTEKI